MLGFDLTVLIEVGFPALGRRFLTWKLCPPRKAGKKPPKVPCDAKGVAVDHTDQRHWLEFDQAADIATCRRLGLGVALGWGLAGVDIDRCLDSAGALIPTQERGIDVAKILAHFPTYIEVSPSGTGIKAYFTVTRGFLSAVDERKDIELYGGRRWFACTGKPLGTVQPITDCTASARRFGWTIKPPTPLHPQVTRAAAPPPADVLERVRGCEIVRERPSTKGGTVFSLKRCPFTFEEHPGGGPYAVLFPDGGAFFKCARSTHGPQCEWVPPPLP